MRQNPGMTLTTTSSPRSPTHSPTRQLALILPPSQPLNIHRHPTVAENLSLTICPPTLSNGYNEHKRHPPFGNIPYSSPPPNFTGGPPTNLVHPCFKLPLPWPRSSKHHSSPAHHPTTATLQRRYRLLARRPSWTPWLLSYSSRHHRRHCCNPLAIVDVQPGASVHGSHMANPCFSPKPQCSGPLSHNMTDALKPALCALYRSGWQSYL
mgnify:CR=1 FL=1